MPIRDFETYSPQIASTAYIDPLAVVIGQVIIGEYTSLWPFVVARGDINRITIEARTNIQDNTVLHVNHDGPYCLGGQALFIGEEVTVGHQSILHACTIEHHCLIGMGAIVLDGAVLQPYTLLAAGSLVSPGKVLEGGYLWRGRPAQKARLLTDAEREYLSYSANHYIELAQQHQRSNRC